jgi:hypothetical protein
MKLLTPDEKHTLHHRYIHNDLYRQWSPILSKLQRENDEADAQTIWYVAEQIIIRLRSELAFREQEIPLIYNELLTDCLDFSGSTRTKEQAKRTAATMMSIVLTMLMNAVEKGHELESFANEPMCTAIIDLLSDEGYFRSLMKLFFKRIIGYDGKKVVITSSDPMQKKTDFESMDEMATEEIRLMVQNVVSRTQRLKPLFGSYWDVWEPLWCDICADTKFLLLLKKINPRTTDWGLNEKMICNVIGMFRDKTVKLSVSIQTINKTLCQKNVRSYLSNHADYDSTNSVFNIIQHDNIEKMIDKHILSVKRN